MYSRTKELGPENKGRLKIWETATAKLRAALKLDYNDLRTLAFHPDGKILGLVNQDGVQLWDVVSDKPAGTRLEGVGGDVTGLAWSRRGDLLLTTWADGFGGPSQVRWWDLDTGRVIGSPARHPRSVQSLSFLPGERTFFTESSDDRVRYWAPAAAIQARRALVQPGKITHLAFQERGSKLAIMSVGLDSAHAGWQLQMWHTAKGERLGAAWLTKDSVRPVGFSPHGNWWLMENFQGNTTLRLDPSTGRLQPLPLLHRKAIRAAVVHEGGKVAALASRDPLLYLWEPATGKPIGRPLSHTFEVSGLIFSGDGNSLLCIATEKNNPHDLLVTWRVPEGGLAGPVVEVRATIQPAISPDGQTLLAGGPDKQAQLWEVVTGKPKGAPILHADLVHWVSFGPDGNTFLTASRDTAHLWATATQQPLGPPWSHPAPIASVAFNPRQPWVVTGCEDKLVRIWDTDSGRLLGPPIALPEVIHSIRFSPDNQSLLLVGNKTAWLQAMPAPLADSPDRIRRWIEVITGMELDEYGTERFLSPDAWRQRKARL